MRLAGIGKPRDREVPRFARKDVSQQDSSAGMVPPKMPCLWTSETTPDTCLGQPFHIKRFASGRSLQVPGCNPESQWRSLSSLDTDPFLYTISGAAWST